jgi:hypothetical protein
MDDLLDGMYARIRAAGAVHSYRVIRDPRQRPLQRSLHGAHPLFLELPAMETAAIVLDAHGDAEGGEGLHLTYFARSR